MSNTIYSGLVVDQYRPKPRISLNKRSELISLYKNIVNISKQSPLYMFHIDSESQNYAIELKEAAMEFRSFLSNISSGAMSEIFHSKRAFSSDEESVDAEIITNDYNTLPAPFHLKVNHLATSQMNTGRETENSNTAIKAGEHILSVSVDDTIYDFKFQIDSGTTNRTVQNKLAEVINQSKTGLQAQVLSGKNSSSSKLVITSIATGGSSNGNPVFSFTDKTTPSRSRSIAEYFGLNQITAEASNSQFELNEVSKESLSNSFSFNKSLKITLNQVTDKDIMIDYVSDEEKITSLLKATAAIYNDMMNTAKHYAAEQKRAEVFVNDFNKILTEYREDLKICGLIHTEDNNLAVDETIASEAARNGQLEQVFYNNEGLFAELQKKAAIVTINPMHYVDKTLVTYPNHNAIPYPNPYITSIYSGMLCNCYC